MSNRAAVQKATVLLLQNDAKKYFFLLFKSFYKRYNKFIITITYIIIQTAFIKKRLCSILLAIFYLVNFVPLNISRIKWSPIEAMHGQSHINAIT